jgi:signal peptidase II
LHHAIAAGTHCGMAAQTHEPRRSRYEQGRPAPAPIAICIALVVFGCDQLSKYIVSSPLALQQRGAIELLPFFGLRWEENRGVSMNFLKAGDETSRWLLVAFTAMICIGVAVWLWREKRRVHSIALALVLGGALGNILDRVHYGFVVDFADLHFGEWRPFLIFNGADVAITVGVLLLLGMSLLSREPQGG